MASLSTVGASVEYLANNIPLVLGRLRRTRSTVGKQANDSEQPDALIASPASFNQVTHWFGESSLARVTVEDVHSIVENHLLPSNVSEANRSFPRLESLLSSPSFFENKYGFRETNLGNSFEQDRLLRRICSINRSPLAGYVQFRGFRSRTASSGLGVRSSVEPESFFTLRGPRGGKDTGLSPKEQKEIDLNDKLRSMLQDQTLSQEEQQRLRIAFAEGYVQSSGRPRQSTRMRMFNVFRDVMGIILICAILLSFMGEAPGGPFRRVLIGSSNEVSAEDIDVTFADVQGVEEAKKELQEVVEFLKNPEKFSSLGGKLPKGVLLVGPPGTGKTLLARAVAGEAKVPFFHAAGPEFDEILVGQGARRVRDLFHVAKMRAPCVIFIDEIDSVGAKRTNSVLHPYANQTINQLLTEMDGFRRNEGVIVLGATNRRDDLDKALLRPGRFDVEIQVPVPDLTGRVEILSHYLAKVKQAKDISLDVLARGTTGFTGADLENMVNQAALRAAIDSAESVGMKYLEEARDKILMGPERRSRIPDEEANIITAYHEGGHALVALFSKDAHPVHKVTIVPRGPSLGHTAYIPEKERYHITKAQMLASLDTLMGGRAAEELIFGPEKVTSGASSDLKQATQLATHMVKEWGMSEKVGVRTFDDHSGSLVVVNELSPSTSDVIDTEIRRLLSESLDRAKNILRTHQKEHRILAEALLKYETLDAADVQMLLAGKQPER